MFPYYILNVTKRRTKSVRRHTKNILGDFLCPPKLRDDFVIAQSSKGWMTPGVHTDLVPTHVFRLQGMRELENPRANGKECRLELLLIQVLKITRLLKEITSIYGTKTDLKKVRGIECRSIIVGQSPVHCLRAGDDVRIARTTTACPPATGRVGHCVRIG